MAFAVPQAYWDFPEVSEMQQSLTTAEVARTIIALQEYVESFRQTELERVSRRHVGFRPEQQDVIEELTRGIVTRILRLPVKVLEAASYDKEPAALLSMVHRIFGLGNRPAARPSNCRRSITEPLQE